MKNSFAVQTMRGTLVMMAIVIGLMLTVSACQPKANSNDSNAGNGGASNDGNSVELSEVWTEKGYVVAKEAGRWLVTVYEAPAGEQPRKEAGWFVVNEQTAVISDQGQAIDPEAVLVGSRVKLSAAGAIAESYPVQGKASEIVLLGNPDSQAGDQTNGPARITEAEAVRNALQYNQKLGAIGPWYIVKTVFDEADYQWLVQVTSETEWDQVETIVLDAATGHVIEKPVAENAAFRVYEPQANTMVDGKFTVRGDARVFEGAFSWRLEDGHFVLKEGHAMADQGAPGWGSFRFDVEWERATNPVVMLILYEASAKDGSPQHELMIPLQADPSLIERIDGTQP